MKKIVLLIITIIIVILAFVSYHYFNYKIKVQNENNSNKIYESFYQVNVLGTDVASLINRVQDENVKNKIKSDNKGFFIENDTDSIKLNIKFLEQEEIIEFESIVKKGVPKFIEFFGSMEFKCTSIEYHNKTGNIKYIHFEQTK